MSIIKIHLYRSNSTKEEKYLLTYIPQIHPTITSFLEFAINALHIELTETDHLVVENDGYVIPQCLDAKILEQINSLTIKVITNSNIKKNTTLNVTPLLSTSKVNDKPTLNQHEEQCNELSKEPMDEENLSDSSTPKFSEDGITKNRNELIPFNKNKKPTQKIQPEINKKKIETKKSKKSKINQPSSSEEEEEQEKEIEIKPNKLELKKTKKIESFKKESSSEESSDSEKEEVEESESGNESSSESSESSEEELPRVIRTKKAQIKSKIHEKELQQHNKKMVEEKKEEMNKKSVETKKLTEKNPLLEKFTKAEKPLHNKEENKISVEKPIVKSTFTQEKIKPTTTTIEKAKLPSPLTITTIEKQKQLPVTYANRKKLIEADDIESSDSSESLEVIKKRVNQQKEMSKVGDINIKVVESKVQEEKYGQQLPINKTKMVPPSLRNKNVQQQQQREPQQKEQQIEQQQLPKPLISAFKQHQLQQWMTVTKELLSSYKETLPSENKEVPFLKINNLIRFKEIELDEERFIPKESEWIEGTVNKIESDGRLGLVKVTQFGKEFRERYDTYEHNMVVLEVNRNYLTQEQRDIMLPHEKNTNNNNIDNNNNIAEEQQQSEVVNQQEQQQTNPSLYTENEKQQKEDKNSIEKFICGQVNYYFSDKNYPFDLFMQMHANKHPEKYIPIRFLLNFPKIKKILKDEHKLLQYLVQDEKRSERNFEVDEIRRLVRKKIAKVNNEEGLKEQQPINSEQKGEEENKEIITPEQEEE